MSLIIYTILECQACGEWETETTMKIWITFIDSSLPQHIIANTVFERLMFGFLYLRFPWAPLSLRAKPMLQGRILHRDPWVPRVPLWLLPWWHEGERNPLSGHQWGTRFSPSHCIAITMVPPVTIAIYWCDNSHLYHFCLLCSLIFQYTVLLDKRKYVFLLCGKWQMQ